MKYLLLVGHATVSEGMRSALEMLMGSHPNVMSFGMGESMSTESFREGMRESLGQLTDEDEVVLIGDIAGGSPLTNAAAVLGDLGIRQRMRVFGGMNLPMVISALMAIEEGLALEALCDVVLADGAEAVRAV